MFKKRRYIFLFALLVYVILLTVLVASEAGAEGSNIHGFGDALWYSIVTLTTVGYGDSYPVSVAGRVVGGLLVFCSLGLVSAIITGTVATLTGYALPLSKLKRYRHFQWHVFLSDTEASLIMAEELVQDNPECVAIFFDEGEHRTVSVEGEESRIFYVEGTLRWLFSIHRGIDGVNVFCFGEDGWENYKVACRIIHDFRIPVYSLTELKSDYQVPNLRLFDPVEGLGRFYWRKYPVCREDRCYILVGCEEVGCSLLERGLQTNIYQPDRGIHYIVAGEAGHFQMMHYRLFEGENLAPDKLTFYDSLWDIAPEVIEAADRIILCHNHEGENLSDYQKLVSHYPLQGKVHVYSGSMLQRAGTETFGQLRDIYTPALVMQDKRSEMAQQMHELFRKSAIKATTDWKGLTEFQKQSNIAAADHILVKCRILLGDTVYDRLTAWKGIETVLAEAAVVYKEESKDPEKRKLFRNIEHNRWVRFEVLNNWCYNEQYDQERRWNPLLVPYEALPEEVSAKDDNAWALIGEALSR